MLEGWFMLTVPLVVDIIKGPLRFRYQQMPVHAQQQQKSTMTTMMIAKMWEPMSMVIMLQTSSE